MRLFHFLVTSATLSTVFALSACSPTLDWREVRFEGTMEASEASPLTALLPCKPDRATREQTVGGERVSLSMIGCTASGATFTLSRMVLKNSAKTPQVLAAWQAAALANSHPINTHATVPTQPETIPFKVPGASGWPAAVRMNLSANQMAWFAQLAGADIVLYQAAIYGSHDAKPLAAEATNTFFESLRLP